MSQPVRPPVQLLVAHHLPVTLPLPYSLSVRFHSSTTCSRSAPRNNHTSPSRLSGSSTIPSSTASICPSSLSIVPASYRSRASLSSPSNSPPLSLPSFPSFPS